MSITEDDIKNIHDDIFKSDWYKNAMKEVRSKTPEIISQFIDALSNKAGGGLTRECTLDEILVIIGYCIGRANVRIHDNYKKAISKFKVIIAPVSALKRPNYRLIRDILIRLSTVLAAAVLEVTSTKN